MAHWLRLILSIFALCGLLAASVGGAMAAQTHHQAHHCCPAMSAETASHAHQGQADDCDATSKCCIFGLCAMPASLAATQASALVPRLVARASFPLFILAGPPSRTSAPDLRPPIA
ncbi:hypothetical protein [Rhodoblastus sp.]|uniref:hypothetical protein n=1 Tax=Rhodoblastus sp. TaxID=1962975 RepID=UPI0035B46E44